ncbi:A disintegrin and metalloproteinase with thrombospondin motifs 18-like [Haliotis rufescens]|uniref:A disintegrin and metalloproteinase with thrombospondin motifs 18-like n=1 Tax=Haliotis rufescens TaxID=6454 RepID=UPI00201F31C9|nr:A disintegrin and metalloproteinase with thrombospondin motifs 18-like [Haliotis rufescens]
MRELFTLLVLHMTLGIYTALPPPPNDVTQHHVRADSDEVPICIPPTSICSLNDRGHLQIEFSALGRAFKLHLVPSHPLTSAYGDYGIPIMIWGKERKKVKMLKFHEHNIHFYHDQDTLGAFAVQFHVSASGTQFISLDGILPGIDYDVVVSPVRTSGSRWAQDGGVTSLHKVLKRIPDKTSHAMSPSHLVPRDTHTATASPPGSVKGTVEVLVWTDFSMYQSFLKQVGSQGNVDMEITWYVAVVVNAADKIYKDGIRDPTLNISLTLAGTIVCTTPECSRFTESHRINDTVNNHIALDDFAVQLSQAYKETRIHFRFDQATALTRLDIVDPNGTPIGVSFTDKICSLYDGKSSSLVEDQGAFSCVGTVAHELAHVLGSDHDGAYRGKSCSAADGYIMSPLSPLVTNGFYFSQCSIDSMKKNLLKQSSYCIYNKAPVNHLYESVSTTMPGQVYNASQQCGAIYGTDFCLSTGTTLADICHKMWCWDPQLTNVCSTKSAAALGTSCGPNKWCVEGACLYDRRAPI